LTKLNIHQRINAIMKDLSYIQKEKEKVNNQYTFVSHDAVTMAVQPKLVEHGVVVIPSVISHDQEWTQYDDTYNGQTKIKWRGFTSVDINVSFVNIDDPEDKFDVQFFGYGIDEQDKGPGKAFSYAKKYAFLQVFCLGTGDDPERDNVNHKPAERPKGKSRSAMNTEAREIIKEMKASSNLGAYMKSERVQKFKADCKEFEDMDTLQTVIDEFERLNKKPDLSQEEIDQRVDWYIGEIQSEKNAETCGKILQTAQKFLKDNGIQHGSNYHQELTQVFKDQCKQLAAV